MNRSVLYEEESVFDLTKELIARFPTLQHERTLRRKAMAVAYEHYLDDSYWPHQNRAISPADTSKGFSDLVTLLNQRLSEARRDLKPNAASDINQLMHSFSGVRLSSPNYDGALQFLVSLALSAASSNPDLKDGFNATQLAYPSKMALQTPAPLPCSIQRNIMSLETGHTSSPEDVTDEGFDEEPLTGMPGTTVAQHIHGGQSTPSMTFSLGGPIVVKLNPTEKETGGRCITLEQLKQDVTSLLFGFGGGVFTLVNDEFVVQQAASIRDLISGEFCCIVSSLLSAGMCCRRLRLLLDSYCKRSVVMDAFRTAVGLALAKWCDVVNDACGRNNLTVTQLVVQLQPLCEQISVLNEIAAKHLTGTFSPSFEANKGVELMSELFELLTFRCLPGYVVAMVTPLLEQSLDAYLRLVRRWVDYGFVADGAPSIFIQEDETILCDRTRNWWKTSYTLRKDLIPNFISGDICNAVLRAGKTTKLLEISTKHDACIMTDDWVAVDSLFETFRFSSCSPSWLELERVFSEQILAESRLNQRALSAVLVNDGQLFKHIDYLRQTLLCQNGAFFSDLSRALFFDYYGDGEVVRPQLLNSLLRNALAAGRLTEQPFTSNVTLALLAQSSSTVAAQHSAATTDEVLNFDMIGRLSLHYDAPWPVNIIISDFCVDWCSKIFQFLLKNQSVMYEVRRTRQQLLTTRGGRRCAFDERQRRGLEVCLGEMHHFVLAVQNYLGHQVIQIGWTEFNAELATTLSKDDGGYSLESLHWTLKHYVNRAVNRCFLNEKAASLHKCLIDVFERMVEFCRALRTDGNGDKSDAAFARFRRKVEFLYRVVEQLTLTDYEPWLADLLLRICTNDFYKKW